MKRARLLAFAAIALCGCRAVLGIETLTVDEDASTPNEDGAVNDSASDTTVPPTGDSGKDGSIDSPADAPADHAPPPDGPPPFDSACADSGMCPACCRNTYATAVGIYEGYAIQAGCLCASTATCEGVCDASICANEFDAQPSIQCNQCVDPLLAPNAPCVATGPANQCQGNANCVPYLECLGSCGQH